MSVPSTRPIPMRLRFSCGPCVALVGLLAQAGEAATLTPDVEIIADVPGADDRFGYAVATDGATVVVGAPEFMDPSRGPGHAEVFVQSAGTWTREARLMASDGADGDGLGWAVAVDGDTALIGAQWPASLAPLGAAYVFVRQGATWVEEASLIGSDREAYDLFGRTVALEGDVAVVGAYQHGLAALNGVGSVYVFERSGGTWTETARMTPAGALGSEHFGESLALEGDTLVVGARIDDVAGHASAGTVRVLTRAAGAWTEGATLLPPLPSDDGHFGESVALNGDRILVGEPQADPRGSNSGCAHVFVRSGGTWILEETLVASDAATIEFAGTSVALESNRALVGAFQKVPVGGGANHVGAVIVFERCGRSWAQTDRLQLVAPMQADQFASSLDVGAGGIVVAGAPQRDPGALLNAGSAAIFTLAPMALAPEVSASGREPLLARRAAGGWTLSFEDLGAAAVAYNEYEGRIGSWYSHVATACDAATAPDGIGRLALMRPLPVDDTYVLVTSKAGCGEGPTGSGTFGPHPINLLACP